MKERTVTKEGGEKEHADTEDFLKKGCGNAGATEDCCRPKLARVVTQEKIHGIWRRTRVTGRRPPYRQKKNPRPREKNASESTERQRASIKGLGAGCFEKAGRMQFQSSKDDAKPGGGSIVRSKQRKATSTRAEVSRRKSKERGIENLRLKREGGGEKRDRIQCMTGASRKKKNA